MFYNIWKCLFYSKFSSTEFDLILYARNMQDFPHGVVDQINLPMQGTRVKPWLGKIPHSSELTGGNY